MGSVLDLVWWVDVGGWVEVEGVELFDLEVSILVSNPNPRSNTATTTAVIDRASGKEPHSYSSLDLWHLVCCGSDCRFCLLAS